MAKLWREARAAESEEDKQKVMKQMMEKHPDVKFDFPKPAEFGNTNEVGEGKAEETEKKVNNILKTEQTV